MDELVDQLHKSGCLHLVAKLGHKLQTLVKVKHVHVGKDSVLHLLHDADANGIETHFVHCFLKIGDLIGIADRLTLLVLVVVLTSEVLQRLPVLFAEDLVFKVHPNLVQL